MISRSAYRIATGFFAMLIAGTVMAFYFDPMAWSQYSEMMRSEHLLNEFAPTLGEAFRYLIHRDAAWPQFVPEVAGCVWAACLDAARAVGLDGSRHVAVAGLGDVQAVWVVL